MKGSVPERYVPRAGQLDVLRGGQRGLGTPGLARGQAAQGLIAPEPVLSKNITGVPEPDTGRRRWAGTGCAAIFWSATRPTPGLSASTATRPPATRPSRLSGTPASAITVAVDHVETRATPASRSARARSASPALS